MNKWYTVFGHTDNKHSWYGAMIHSRKEAKLTALTLAIEHLKIEHNEPLGMLIYKIQSLYDAKTDQFVWNCPYCTYVVEIRKQ